MSTSTNVLDFNAAIDRSVLATEDRLRRIFVRACLMMIGSVVDGEPGYSPGTPVDTGHARSGWYTFLAGSGAVPNIADAATQGDPVAQAIEALADAQLGQTVWCANHVPYIVRLEYGWSQQAPAGMVRLTLSASQEIVDEAARIERAA